MIRKGRGGRKINISILVSLLLLLSESFDDTKIKKRNTTTGESVHYCAKNEKIKGPLCCVKTRGDENCQMGGKTIPLDFFILEGYIMSRPQLPWFFS